jgi:predicted DNA-binding ribbon-helix-helix protein
VSTLVSRNVTLLGRRTSLRLERAMWEALEEICLRENQSMHDLCTHVDRTRAERTLTAGIRVYILEYYRRAATEDGHGRAGHGTLER